MLLYTATNSRCEQVDFRNGPYACDFAMKETLTLTIDAKDLPVHSIVVAQHPQNPSMFLHIVDGDGNVIVPSKQICHPNGGKNKPVISFQNLEIFSSTIRVHLENMDIKRGKAVWKPGIRWIKLFRDDRKPRQPGPKPKKKMTVPPFPMELFLHPDDLASLNGEC